MLIGDRAQSSHGGYEDGLQLVDVKPTGSAGSVGHENKVHRPFGWWEEGGGEFELGGGHPPGRSAFVVGRGR